MSHSFLLVCLTGPLSAEAVFHTRPEEGMKGSMEGFLLVDDRSGRVLLEIVNPVKAFRVLDHLWQDEPELADAACLVTFDDRGGVLIGAETTTRVRSLC